MVGQEKLEDAVLRLPHAVVRGVDDHAVGDLHEAGWGEGRPARPLDVDKTHAAHADGLHARVVAEAWDVGAGPLGGRDEQLALARGDGAAVHGERELFGRHAFVVRLVERHVSQRGTPLL